MNDGGVDDVGSSSIVVENGYRNVIVFVNLETKVEAGGVPYSPPSEYGGGVCLRYRISIVLLHFFLVSLYSVRTFLSMVY